MTEGFGGGLKPAESKTKVKIFNVPFVSKVDNKLEKAEIIAQAFDYHKTGNILDAAKYYRLFIEQGFKDPRVFINYGVILISQGKTNGAIQAFKKAIEFYPDRSDAYANLGGLLKDTGNIEDSEIYLNKAIKLNPKCYASFSNLAGIYRIKGDFEKAESYLRKAINLNPNSAQLYLNLSAVYSCQMKFEQAINLIQNAIKINPKFAEAYSDLGTLLSDQGKFEESKAYFKKSLEINPNLFSANLNLGCVSQKTGVIEDAKMYLKNALSLKPNDANAHANLGGLYRELKQYQESEFHLRKAIEIDQNSAASFYNLGILLRDLGKVEESEKLTIKAISIKPDFSSAFLNLSLISYINGNYKNAFTNIQKAFSLDPSENNVQLIKKIFDYRFSNKGDLLKTQEKINQDLISSPIIIDRPVEKELIDTLYKLKTFDLNRFSDPSFGNARGSDYDLFTNNEKYTKILEKDLTAITKEVVNSDVYFRDSFFTILGEGGIVKKHNHIGPIDKLESLALKKLKFSLVYYLSVGDQECHNPGKLKFYDPEEEVTPYQGMIIIFPADRYHSVVYDGKKDRVIVGVNFYSLS